MDCFFEFSNLLLHCGIVSFETEQQIVNNWFASHRTEKAVSIHHLIVTTVSVCPKWPSVNALEVVTCQLRSFLLLTYSLYLFLACGLHCGQNSLERTASTNKLKFYRSKYFFIWIWPNFWVCLQSQPDCSLLFEFHGHVWWT